MSNRKSFADEVKGEDTPNGLSKMYQYRSLENIYVAWYSRSDEFWRHYWDDANHGL